MLKSPSDNNNGIGMTSMRTRLRLIEGLKKQGINNENVLQAMSEVPRHLFVDEAIAHRSYENVALPIGFGQTISQPYIVARMTQAALGHHSKLKSILEIGTGSGYQAAVLAKLAEQVYTVERIKDLYNIARQRFNKHKIFNINTTYDDSLSAWVTKAPFDAIIVTCAANDIPEELLNQLAEGGRLVIPVKSSEDYDTQQLLIITKNNNHFTNTYLELVKFVPMLPGKA